MAGFIIIGKKTKGKLVYFIFLLRNVDGSFIQGMNTLLAVLQCGKRNGRQRKIRMQKKM